MPAAWGLDERRGPAMTQPTPAMVVGLWDHLRRTFGTTVVSKPGASEMRALADLLGRLGIVDARAFLSEYATTLGRRIYIPFAVGRAERGWSLWQQIIAAVHEHQHVVQLDEHGSLAFAVRYIGSRSGRALLEAEAYRTSLELHYWRFNALPRLEGMAQAVLGGYGLRKDDIEVAQRVLELSALAIGRGAIVSRAGKVAIEWLARHAPALQLRGASA